MTLKDREIKIEVKKGVIGWYYSDNDVKEFIEKILDLLDDDVDEREKYIAERIKEEAGDLE